MDTFSPIQTKSISTDQMYCPCRLIASKHVGFLCFVFKDTEQFSKIHSSREGIEEGQVQLTDVYLLLARVVYG